MGDLITLILIIVASYWFKIHFKKDGFKGMFTSENISLGLILLIPFFIYIIGNYSLNIIFNILFVFDFSLSLTVMVVVAAILEEVVFRGFLITNYMRIWEDKIIWVMLVPGLIFGLLHLTNLIEANVGITIFQTIDCICFGCFVGAIFLRTGNLWFPIFAHCFNNFLASLDSTAVNAQGYMIAEVGFIDIFALIFSIMLLIFAFHYVRSSKHEDIKKIWNEKWSKG